ncbi:hypothetical protein ACFFF7_13570 [Novosphingobium aquiterrae]|uniref:Uncharacterized protein n=1 Tax=Novosphingobium aquiterrae TaxID=624388 RepID=A0ABV6PKS0_9SPHN
MTEDLHHGQACAIMDEPGDNQREQQAAFRDALADLAFGCAYATPDGGCDQIDALAALVQAHPHWSAIFDTSVVTRLVQTGADASAALALVEQVGGYMLSRAPGGRHLATVVLAGQSQEVHAEGASAALALIGALATALAAPASAASPHEGSHKSGPELRLN